jgi:hypothetical protein
MTDAKLPANTPWYKSKRFLSLVGVIVLVVVIGAPLLLLAFTQQPPPQTVPYSHQPHIKAGMSCLFCHVGANSQKTAGLPTRSSCEGCHGNIPAGTNANLKALEKAFEAPAPFKWVPVAIQPDFVYFSHRPHIVAGLNCENCHGDVGNMTYAQPQPRQNMGWCLDCHKTMRPDKFIKLSDCATCHK